MKFSTREDIDASIDTVFGAVSDFDAFERQLLRRGIDIRRSETDEPAAPGTRWRATIAWRQKPHEVDARLISVDPGTGYAIESHSAGVVCIGVVDLVALSKTRTRLFVSLDLRPTTLSARLLVQSLRLTKHALTRRFKARVAEFARSVPEGA